jgi:hypothetical protein
MVFKSFKSTRVLGSHGWTLLLCSSHVWFSSGEWARIMILLLLFKRPNCLEPLIHSSLVLSCLVHVLQTWKCLFILPWSLHVGTCPIWSKPDLGPLLWYDLSFLWLMDLAISIFHSFWLQSNIEAHKCGRHYILLNVALMQLNCLTKAHSSVTWLKKNFQFLPQHVLFYVLLFSRIMALNLHIS